MRNRYMVSYDISDPKRLRRVFRIMRGFGDHIQYSVFFCDLSSSEKVQLFCALTESINHREDSIYIVDMGPSRGRGGDCIETMGKACKPEVRNVIFI